MSRCPACDPNCRIVLGQGPLPCPALLIGEKPGREEASRGRPFVGDTGQELDATYLGLAGWERPEVRVTNAVKCRLGDNNNQPSPAQVRHCASHWLPGEIADCQPSIIVLMGATACSLVPKIELELDHGRPVWVQAEDSEFLGDWEGWVWPSFHPAAGLHESRMMTPLLEDWERLGRWRRGKWKAPRPPVEALDYGVVQDITELERDFLGFDRQWVAVDTENDGPCPWSLQYSLRPGHSRLIRASDPEILMWFSRLAYRSTFILHHAVHDLDVLENMGIRPQRFRDTMQEAFQLGNQPQGLKALGWRLLGIRMRSWEDLVMPYSRRAAQDWLIREWDEESGRREKVEVQLVTKVKISWRPSQRERDLKRLLTHAPKPTYELWDKMKEAGLTGYPIPSIAHVPEAEAVRYACQDADVTGQVAAILKGLREGIVDKEWRVDEGDYDT